MSTVRVEKAQKAGKEQGQVGFVTFFAPTAQLGAPDLCQFSCHAIRSPSFVHGGQLAPKFAHILVFIS